MKKNSCLFVLFFIVRVLIAQPTNPLLADSLKKEFLKAKHDTLKVLILEKLSGYYISVNTTLALRYGRQGWTLADRIRYDKGKILCAITTGHIMASTSDYAEALSKLVEAIHLCEKNRMNNELVSVYFNLSLLYSNQKQFPEALDYLSKAKKIQDKYHFFGIPNSLNLTSGYVYKDMGKNDSALIFFQRAYKYAIKNNLTTQFPDITFYIGNSFWKMQQKDSALKYFHQSLSYKASYNKGRVFYGLASIFKSTNQVDSSIFYAKKALNHSHEYKYLVTAINSAQLLSEQYENKNDIKEALKYYKISSLDKDSLSNQEKARQLERLSHEEKKREVINRKRELSRQLAFENQIKIYSLIGILLGLGIFAFILYRNNKIKQRANALLHTQKEEIGLQREKAEKALTELKATQNQLVQAEKMASLGELTAGIAHEIQNPLNFVNNFSEMSVELAQELNEEVEKEVIDKDLVKEILSDLTQNQQKINHHGKRASSIVKGMLEHSRTSTGIKELTDINALADEYLRLSYHGLRAKDKNGSTPRFNADFKTNFDENLPKVEVIPQDFGRVLLNLINNAFYAVQQKNKLNLEGYKPLVNIETHLEEDEIVIKIQDNGSGMPDSVKAKIFQPFFTTKPTGEGTGLGLSLAYDIITKAHGGTLEVESKEGEGSEFTIKLFLL